MSDKAIEASEAVKAEEEKRETRIMALFIVMLALVLSVTNVLGDDAKAEAQLHNVEAANYWAFFQARSIRQTVLAAQIDRAVIDVKGITSPEVAAELTKQIDRWRATIARWESEPETNEGRKELAVRAKQAEQTRETASQEDNWYDTASIMLETGIVLTSTAILTGIVWFAWLGVGVGALGGLVSLSTFIGFL